MRKYFLIFAITALSFSQFSFANDKHDSDKQCDAVVSACKNAGYTEEGMGDKSFWFGCMKPLLLGKTVTDVSIDAKEVKECRKAKIKKMKKELKEFQSVK